MGTTYARSHFSGGVPNYTISTMSPSAPLLTAVEGRAMAIMRSIRKLSPENENFSIMRDSIAKSLIENLGMVTVVAFIIGIITY